MPKLSATRHGTSWRWAIAARVAVVSASATWLSTASLPSRAVYRCIAARRCKAVRATRASTGRTCRLATPLMRLRISASTTEPELRFGGRCVAVRTIWNSSPILTTPREPAAALVVPTIVSSSNSARSSRSGMHAEMPSPGAVRSADWRARRASSSRASTAFDSRVMRLSHGIPSPPASPGESTTKWRRPRLCSATRPARSRSSSASRVRGNPLVRSSKASCARRPSKFVTRLTSCAGHSRERSHWINMEHHCAC